MNNEFFECSSLADDEKTSLLTQFFQLSHLIIDSKGIVQHVSDEFSLLIGDSVGNVRGTSFTSLLPAGCNDFFASEITTNNSSIFHEKLQFADGSIKAVEFKVCDITIASETLKVVSHFSMLDLDNLRDSSHLFEQSGIAEFLLTPNRLEIIAANRSAHALSGLCEATLKQMLFSELCELSQQQLIFELKKLNADAGNYLNLDLTDASGEPHLVQLRASPVQLFETTLLHLQLIDISDQKEQKQQLQQAQDLAHSLFEKLPVAALLMDRFGVIEKINSEMSDIFASGTGQLIGQRARSVLPDNLAALVSPLEQSTNVASLKVNNQMVHVKFNQQPVRDSKNQTLGLLLTIEPVKTSHLPLRLKALEIANEMTVYSMFVTDKHGEIIYTNEGFEHQSGYKSSGLIGKNMSVLNDPSSDQFVYKNMWDVINKKQIWRGTLKKLKNSGSSYWADVTIKPMLNDLGDIECFVAVCLDVTKQRELHKAGVYLANYDLATGLANEVLAKDRLDGILSRAQRRKLMVAVVYLDITKVDDYSKEVGVVKGNEMLSVYCQMMKSALRDEDALVRMSKNRLAILLPDLPNVTSLEVVVAKIDKINSQSIVISDEIYDLDIRLGVAHYPEQGGDADSLFLNAESSLQRAMHLNERIGSFGEEYNDKAIMNFNLRRDIVTALNNSELTILYQPILALETNSVISLKAMLQWHHQRHGIIDGEDIYAIAEASGRMVELGLWLFEQACVDLVHWRELGHNDLTLSITLSHGQLRDRNIAKNITKILNRYDLPANIISLELPLSHIATQWLDLDVILQEFALLGISLQYDRFGERGAYISDLHNYPFSGLKLSADYISNLSDDPSAASLIQGIIAMAQALNMTVTAVDVRQLSQVLQLQEMGCHYFQGGFSCEFSPRNKIDNFLCQQEGLKEVCWE